MEREASANTAEKQRLRTIIADQIRRFMESGGTITVIDSPSSTHKPKGGAWSDSQDFVALPEA